MLIPRTFTTKSWRSAKRGQNVMNAIRDCSPLLLVLVAVMTDMGAKGRNCRNIYSVFLNPLAVVHESVQSCPALDLVTPT